MSKKKRPSLSAVLEEDARLEKAAKQEAPAKKQKVVAAPPVEPVSMEGDSDGDVARVTVTMPEGLHDELLVLSLKRRRAKQVYNVSAMIREAIMEWLPKQG